MKSHYGYVGGTLSAYLPQDWTLTLDGNWASPMTTGYERQESTCYLNFGIRKMYMKRGLIFNLNIHDLARSMVFTSSDMGLQQGYTSWYRNTIRQQRVMLSVTWMFGSSNISTAVSANLTSPHVSEAAEVYRLNKTV